MSNLQVPNITLAYMRERMPQVWSFIQDQITTILDDPAPVIAAMIGKLGREGAHEAMEASLDAGTLKFVPCPDSDAFFGLAFYCTDADRYYIVAEDGSLHLPEETSFELPPEADDAQ